MRPIQDNFLLSKIKDILQEIRLQFESGVRPIESAEDLRKREKRSFEFSTRITRNYLYQLGRQINDLSENVRLVTGRPSSSLIYVKQKFTNANQLILQALNAFLHYIPQAIISGVQNKFNELLGHVCEICKLTKIFWLDNNLHSHYTVVEEIEDTCNSFFQDDKNKTPMETNAPLEYVPEQKKPKTKVRPQSHNITKKQLVANRLSMYAKPYGNPLINSTVVAKQRILVQSRYKQGVYKPKPIIEKADGKKIEEPKIRSSEKSLKVSPREIKQTINDDEVTIVQIYNSEDNKQSACMDSTISLEDKGAKQELQPIQNTQIEEKSPEHKDEFMDQTNFNDVIDKLKDIQEHVKPQIKSEDHKKIVIHPTISKSSFTKLPNRHKSKEKVTGTKNAKLICIKDKSCYEDEVQKIDSNILTTFIEEESNNKVKITKSDETNKGHEERISHFDHLSKKSAINIVQYNLEFRKFTKQNHMYRKTPLIQPWLLISKISDELLDKLLSSVICEIELNHIVERLYKSEFI